MGEKEAHIEKQEDNEVTGVVVGLRLYIDLVQWDRHQQVLGTLNIQHF